MHLIFPASNIRPLTSIFAKLAFALFRSVSVSEIRGFYVHAARKFIFPTSDLWFPTSDTARLALLLLEK
jgi:hypothetical protein